MTQPEHEPTGAAAPAKKPRKHTFKTAAVVGSTADEALGAPVVREPVAVEPAAAPADPETVATARTSKAATTPATTGKAIRVRVTVELEFDEHRSLRRLCDRYADEIGVAQVAGAEAFRALLHLALDDQAVANKLGRALARTGGSRRG